MENIAKQTINAADISNGMEKIIETTKKMLELMGFSDVSVEAEPEGRRIRIFINEDEWIKPWVPKIVSDLEVILRLSSRKEGAEYIFVDVNNYRKERERLIVEIAKAAAKKALLSKAEVSLPAMNAYERRLVHTELSTRPDVKTESVGSGPTRYVIVKPI